VVNTNATCTQRKRSAECVDENLIDQIKIMEDVSVAATINEFDDKLK
jgi:hypothetical protein